MTCIKCTSKIGNKPKAIELNLCNKCYTKKDNCCVDGCKKKMFMSEHCSSHIHLVREVKAPVAFKVITDEDRERRRLRREEKMRIELEFERRHVEVSEYKNTIDYDPFTSAVKKDIIRGLEQDIELARMEELYRAERNLEELKDYYASLPHYNRNKFRRYMEEEPDHHKERKKAKQAAKEQRSRDRGNASSKPRSEKREETKDGNCSDYEDENFSDHEKGIPNRGFTSSGESKFDILVREAFTLLDIIRTNVLSDIKSAYYKQAMKWHPDKNTEEDTTEIFQEIGSAYEFLCKNISNIDA